jgi:hypothetical protein
MEQGGAEEDLFLVADMQHKGLKLVIINLTA